MYRTTKSALSNLARKTNLARGRTSMTTLLPAVCLLLLALAPAARADAIAFSTFDTNTEGWNAVSVNGTHQVVGTAARNYAATGGNPGGHIYGGDFSTGIWYFNAPSAFLGNVSAAYNGSLTFDLRRAGGTLFNAADVVLVGGDPGNLITLCFDIANAPTSAWTSFDVWLNESDWKVGTLAGPQATAGQMQQVLAALTALRIRGEFGSGGDTEYLDNVSLNAAEPEPTPEPAALALMGTGLAGCAIVARRPHRQHKRRRRARDCRHAYAEPAGLSI